MKNKLKVTSILYLLFIIMLLVMAVGGSFLIRRYSYLAGLHHSDEYIKSIPIAIYLLPLLVILTLSSSLIAFVGLFFTNGKISKILCQLLMILLGPAIIFGIFICTPPGAATYLKGFKQYILKEVDIEAVQTWLATKGSIYARQEYYPDYGKDYPEELPSNLTKLHPSAIFISDSVAENGPVINLSWPFGMDGCELIIGPPDMKIPKRTLTETDQGIKEFTRIIKPGAYISIRG